MTLRATPYSRADFVQFVPMATRWNDNDVYGHVNNAVYFQFFDTAANQILVESGVLNLATSSTIGLMVETRCTYFASLAFPCSIEVGVAVEHVGRTSVRYRLGIFAAPSARAAAQGAFTHVYVARDTQKPVEIPAPVRAVLERLHIS